MSGLLLPPAIIRLRKMERLIRMGGATAERMMEATGASIATFKRDLELLRLDLGADVVYCSLSGKYELRNQAWPGVVPCLSAMLAAV